MTQNLKAADPLTEREITAARMIAEGADTLKEIAKEAGVARATLYEWRQRQDFRELVAEMTHDTVEHAKTLLRALTSKAVKVIDNALSGVKVKGTQLDAAKQILDRGGCPKSPETAIIQQQAQATVPDDYPAYLQWKAKQEGGAEQC